MKYLIVVAGLIGSGKSTVADRIGSSLDAVVLRTDAIWREIGDDSKDKKNYQADGSILANKQRTYSEMFERTRQLIKQDSVVLDATFSKKDWRDSAKSIAEEHGAGYYFVEVVCENEDEVKRRMEQRAQKNTHAPQYTVRDGQKRNFEAISEDERNFLVRNECRLDELNDQVDIIIRYILGKK